MWALSVLLVSAVTLLLVTLPPTTTALPVVEQEDTELLADSELLDRIPLHQYEDYIDLDVPLKDDPDSSLIDQDSLAETSLATGTGSGQIMSDHSSLQVPDTVLSDQIPSNRAIVDGDHSHEASQPQHLDLTVEVSSLEDHKANDQDPKDNNEPLAVEQPIFDAAPAEPIPRQIIMQDDHHESTVVYPSDSQRDQSQTLEIPAGRERTTDEYNQELSFHSSDSQDVELLSAQQQTIDTTTTTGQAEEERIHDSTNNHDNHETLTSPKSQDQQVPTQQITEPTGESMRTTTGMYDEDNQEATADLSSEPDLNANIVQIETADSWNISHHDKKDNLANTGERPVAEDLADNYQDIGAGTILDSSTTTDSDASETSLLADDHGIPTGDDDLVARTTLQSHNSTDASTEAADYLSTQANIETPEITSNSINTPKMEEHELMKDQLVDSTSQESIITTGTDDTRQSASPTDSSTGDQSVLVEDDVSRKPDPNTDASEKAVPPAEGSLASFFEKVKNKKQGETNKFQKKSRQSSTSFEALASQQEQINTIMATQEETNTKLSQNSNDIATSASYAGLPWGVVHGMNRRLPDLDLLYLVFENYLNPDGKLDRNQAMARFPLSMGQEQEQDELEILSDHELEALLSHQQEGINSAMMEAEKLLNKSTTNVEESSDQPNKSSGNVDGPQTEYLRKQRHDNLEGIAFDDLVEGLDDIDKFFLSVDPPDELDVGAASGSSMQELIMGKGKEILVKKVLLAFHFLQEIFATTTKKLATKSLWYKDKASDKIHLLESFQTFDWKETVNIMRTNMRKLFDVVMEFFDVFMDDSTDIHGSDTLDLEAIRKMGGIKL